MLSRFLSFLLALRLFTLFHDKCVETVGAEILMVDFPNLFETPPALIADKSVFGNEGL